MGSFRFLHTADLHLGTPFQGLQRDMPAQSLEQLRRSVNESFDRMIEVAIAQNVEFIVIAGDLFDSKSVSIRHHFALQRGFLELEKQGIDVYLCHGNHDPLSSSMPLSWPPNVHVFPGAPIVRNELYRVPSVLHQTRTGQCVQITGFSYPQAQLFESFASAFVRAGEADFSIGLYHGVVGSAGHHSNYCATSVDELIRQNFDYWALGHIHQPQVIRLAEPTIVYAGNPQGRHIRELGWRGCVLVDVQSPSAVVMQRIETSTVVWDIVHTPIDGCISLNQVIAKAIDALSATAQKYGGMACIVRLQLTGQTPVHALLLASESELIEQIDIELEHRQISVIVEQYQFKTQPMLDFEVLEQSVEFVGEFLRLAKRYESDIEGTRKQIAYLLKDVYHAKNELLLDDLSDDDILDLLHNAKHLVLQNTWEDSDS